ncbi:hypothetical protein ABT262_17615, partial [Amycolatopsis mediterranei]
HSTTHAPTAAHPPTCSYRPNPANEMQSWVSGVQKCAVAFYEGGIAGAVMAAWLAERSETTAESLTSEELCLSMTDHLAAMDELGVLFDELAALGDPSSIVGVIAAADHPARLRLLDVIAQEHPDRKIAKRARKARFTLRQG